MSHIRCCVIGKLHHGLILSIVANIDQPIPASSDMIRSSCIEQQRRNQLKKKIDVDKYIIVVAFAQISPLK